MSTSLLSSELKPLPVGLAINHHNPFVYVERQSRQVQQELQLLLDAQCAGLNANLADPSSQDDASTIGSPPTTATDAYPLTTLPVRQPPKKKIGLRAARRGILKSMNQLLSVKEEENRIIDSELEDRRAEIHRIAGFMDKQNELEGAIARFQDDRKELTAENLLREAGSLEDEIRETETKLLEMKARHRHLLAEASQIQNSVDAKLSSYKGSLSLLESKVRNYLDSPPLQPLAPYTPAPPPFHSLNPKRRTLEIAKTYWTYETRGLRAKQRATAAEIAALREGGAVWHRVMKSVSDFEDLLQDEMRRLSLTETQLVDVDQDRGDAIMRALEDTRTELEKGLQKAEDKHWNLLICCIGAELEALEQAKLLLKDSFTSSPKEEDEGTGVGVPSDIMNGSQHEDLLTDRVDGKRRAKSPKSRSNSRSRTQSPSPDPAGSRSEDDEDPDPAWFMS